MESENSSLSSKFKSITRWAWIYCIVSLGASLFVPSWVAWENGPLEMLQNIILAFGVVLSIHYFKNTAGLPAKFHRFWIPVAGYFAVLLGRELSWGRVFLVRYMTEEGPVIVSMKDLPHHVLISGSVSVFVGLVIISFLFSVPWKTLLMEIPFPKSGMLLFAVAAVLAALGDKGMLYNSAFDNTAEEFMEMLVYLLNLYFASWYYRGIKDFLKK